MTASPALVAVNLLGYVEHPVSGPGPYRVGRDGTPYLPVGDGGIVLGVGLGDGVFAHHGDHVAGGVCVVHPDAAARAALTAYSCIGDIAVVRTGAQQGRHGVVIGKRGEEGRVVVSFPPEVLAGLRPDDQVSVRTEGQGLRLAGAERVTVHNIRRQVIDHLPVEVGDGAVRVGVRCALPSKLMGNGIGRPAVQWCLDLQVDEHTAGAHQAAGMALGDLVAVTDVDSRWNIGLRRGWTTVGAVVHGGSPLPGHGPGITPLFTGPPGSITIAADESAHRGLTSAVIEEVLIATGNLGR
jgi:hypothetical protein